MASSANAVSNSATSGSGSAGGGGGRWAGFGGLFRAAAGGLDLQPGLGEPRAEQADLVLLLLEPRRQLDRLEPLHFEPAREVVLLGLGALQGLLQLLGRLQRELLFIDHAAQPRDLAALLLQLFFEEQILLMRAVADGVALAHDPLDLFLRGGEGSERLVEARLRRGLRGAKGHNGNLQLDLPARRFVELVFARLRLGGPLGELLPQPEHFLGNNLELHQHFLALLMHGHDLHPQRFGAGRVGLRRLLARFGQLRLQHGDLSRECGVQGAQSVELRLERGIRRRRRGRAGGQVALGLLAQDPQFLLGFRQLFGEFARSALRRVPGLPQAQQLRFHLHRARRRTRSPTRFGKARAQFGVDALPLLEARREGRFLVLRRAEAGARFPSLLLELIDRHPGFGRHRHIQRGSVARHIDNGGRSPRRRGSRIRRIGAVAEFWIRRVHGGGRPLVSTKHAPGAHGMT